MHFSYTCWNVKKKADLRRMPNESGYNGLSAVTRSESNQTIGGFCPDSGGFVSAACSPKHERSMSVSIIPGFKATALSQRAVLEKGSGQPFYSPLTGAVGTDFRSSRLPPVGTEIRCSLALFLHERKESPDHVVGSPKLVERTWANSSGETFSVLHSS